MINCVQKSCSSSLSIAFLSYSGLTHHEVIIRH